MEFFQTIWRTYRGIRANWDVQTLRLIKEGKSQEYVETKSKILRSLRNHLKTRSIERRLGRPTIIMTKGQEADLEEKLLDWQKRDSHLYDSPKTVGL